MEELKKPKTLKTKEVKKMKHSDKNIHLGQRFKFWMDQYSGKPKGSATKIAHYLGLKDKNSVYARHRKSDMKFEEILKLCQWFDISIAEFTGLMAADMGIDIPKKYIPIEQRMDRMESLIEEFLKSTPK